MTPCITRPADGGSFRTSETLLARYDSHLEGAAATFRLYSVMLVLLPCFRLAAE